MPLNSKVIWTEGMFLRPQHFQQQERYLESFIHNRCMGFHTCGWGYFNLQIDSNLLKTGQLALKTCSGIFPDGTPFNLPEDDDLPLPLEIAQEMQNEIVYLSMPLRQPETGEVDDATSTEGLARYRLHERQISDYSRTGAKAPIQIGKLKTCLMRQSQERAGYTCLGVARVVEARADKNIILDEHYIPPNINCFGMSNLNGFLRELHGLLNTRSEAIAGRVAAAGQGGVAEVADFLLLQLINRQLPLFAHLSQTIGLHPENFYRYGIQLAGELATFFRVDKRPVTVAPYRHDNLQETFSHLMDELRQLFTKDLDQRAVPIPLKGPKYNTYAAQKPDSQLIENAMFILAASADVPAENLRREFPRQTIIAPVEEIRQYVSSLTPGIGIHPLAVAPRQLPYHAGFIYFELEKHSETWRKMTASGGFAIHIGTNFPGLKLEFWAIKEGS